MYLCYCCLHRFAITNALYSLCAKDIACFIVIIVFVNIAQCTLVVEPFKTPNGRVYICCVMHYVSECI